MEIHRSTRFDSTFPSAQNAEGKRAANPVDDSRVRRRIEIPPPNHRPYNDQQGWQKSVGGERAWTRRTSSDRSSYLAAYLFAARGSLKPEEMDAVLSTTEPPE
ncbi:hypothetical protein CN167_26720 [Sinorhizobium medicae]|nr:hypothetical protein CN167_26720 [Sinorhizobium medicae]